MGRLGGTPRPTARNAAADATGRVPPDAAAVAQKRNPAFVPLNVGKDGVGRYNCELVSWLVGSWLVVGWLVVGGLLVGSWKGGIEMVSSCIVNKARQMFILTFLHTKGDDLTIAHIRP